MNEEQYTDDTLTYIVVISHKQDQVIFGLDKLHIIKIEFARGIKNPWTGKMMCHMFGIMGPKFLVNFLQKQFHAGFLARSEEDEIRYQNTKRLLASLNARQEEA